MSFTPKHTSTARSAAAKVDDELTRIYADFEAGVEKIAKARTALQGINTKWAGAFQFAIDQAGLPENADNMAVQQTAADFDQAKTDAQTMRAEMLATEAAIRTARTPFDPNE